MTVSEAKSVKAKHLNKSSWFCFPKEKWREFGTYYKLLKKKMKIRESEPYLWVSTRFAQAEKEIREKQQEER